MVCRIVSVLLVMASCDLTTSVALGAFNTADQRSTNASAETLPQGDGEVGFATLSVGLTDNLMLTVPTLPLLTPTNVYAALIRYKIQPEQNFRLLPEVGVLSFSDLFIYGGGLSVGIDSDNRAHSFTFGLDATHTSNDIARFNLRETDRSALTLISRLNYDYYTDDGNLFFAGANYLYARTGSMLFPYSGFTWAWDHFHLGFMAVAAWFLPPSELSNPMKAVLVPLPYFYWRF